MTIVTTARILDGFWAIRLHLLALARPAGRCTRPADRRSNLPDRSSAAASHTRKEGRISLGIWICCEMCEPSQGESVSVLGIRDSADSVPGPQARGTGGTLNRCWEVVGIRATRLRSGPPASRLSLPIEFGYLSMAPRGAAFAHK
jgi:hypothetical protein